MGSGKAYGISRLERWRGSKICRPIVFETFKEAGIGYFVW